MKIHYLSMVLLFHSVIALGQNSEHKSGTITIQKATNSIEGLYGKMSIHSFLDQDTNKDLSQIKKNKSRFLKSPFDFYFFFLANGTLYQIESSNSPQVILSQIEDNPTKLRPVLASYTVLDSIVSISPLSTGIMEGQEPARSAYIGKLSNNVILLSTRNSTEIHQFEKLE